MALEPITPAPADQAPLHDAQLQADYARRVQAVNDAAAVLYQHASADDPPAIWDITRLADYLATGQIAD